jgi:hypothetical protein
MKVYWDCAHCRERIEHRWEGDRLVFACRGRKPHYFEPCIITSIVRKDYLGWLIPISEILGLIAILLSYKNS